MAVLCGALLGGVFAAPLFHTHAAVEHQHGAQEQHRHESLVHAHLPDGGDSDAVPNVDAGDHGHSDAMALDLPCCLARAKVTSATPGMLANALRATDDLARRSSLELSRVCRPRAPPYLIGPGLRGPPPA